MDSQLENQVDRCKHCGLEIDVMEGSPMAMLPIAMLEVQQTEFGYMCNEIICSRCYHCTIAFIRHDLPFQGRTSSSLVNLRRAEDVVESDLDNWRMRGEMTSEEGLEGLKMMVTLDECVVLLNDLLERDRAAISDLLGKRVKCNDDLAHHPTVQCFGDDSGFTVGLLGVINGLFGIDEVGWGGITAVFDYLAYRLRTKFSVEGRYVS